MKFDLPIFSQLSEHLDKPGFDERIQMAELIRRIAQLYIYSIELIGYRLLTLGSGEEKMAANQIPSLSDDALWLHVPNSRSLP